MSIDRVKPLKIETASDGTQTDFLPTEVNPSQDYLSSKGLALENDSNTRIDKSADGQVQFTDSTNSTKKVSDLLDAEQENFNPSPTDLTSTKTGPAIRELRTKIADSASPGFSYGRSGTVGAGSWLQRDGAVPSNIAGITVGFASPIIKKVTVASQDPDTYTLELYEHEGNGINATLITTLTITATRSQTFNLAVSMTQGKQLGVKLGTGSAKNLGVDISLTGNFT